MSWSVPDGQQRMEWVTFCRTQRRHWYHWSYPDPSARHWVKNLHAVKSFLEKGATVTCEDNKGWNGLYFAAQGGDTDIISLILTHLPDIESKTAYGETPLIIAFRHGKLPAVKYLLERGVNPLAKDNNDQDSLYQASSCDLDFTDLLLSHVDNSESTSGNH